MLRFSMAVAICRWADAPDTSYSDPFPTPEICMAALSFGRRDRRDRRGRTDTAGRACQLHGLAMSAQRSVSTHALGRGGMGDGGMSAWGETKLTRATPMSPRPRSCHHGWRIYGVSEHPPKTRINTANRVSAQHGPWPFIWLNPYACRNTDRERFAAR